MEYIDRLGQRIQKNDKQDQGLKKLYTTKRGRFVLKVAVQPWFTKVCSRFLDSRSSRNLIQPFINANDIDLEQYKKDTFTSYNDFFRREIKKKYRPIRMDQDVLITPCDGKCSVYPIDKHAIFRIKNTYYTVESLTRSEKIGEYYKGGYACILRLTVDDYHRYCYVDDGEKSRNYKIKGILHTVNPIANDYFPIYHENTREYTLLKTKNFGTVLMMEVGALMVGKIVNEQEKAVVKKGQEKGHFEFGGSTIVLLMKKDSVIMDEDLLQNTRDGIETIVKMGEQIGVKNNEA